MKKYIKQGRLCVSLLLTLVMILTLASAYIDDKTLNAANSFMPIALWIISLIAGNIAITKMVVQPATNGTLNIKKGKKKHHRRKKKANS